MKSSEDIHIQNYSERASEIRMPFFAEFSSAICEEAQYQNADSALTGKIKETIRII